MVFTSIGLLVLLWICICISDSHVTFRAKLWYLYIQWLLCVKQINRITYFTFHMLQNLCPHSRSPSWRRLFVDMQSRHSPVTDPRCSACSAHPVCFREPIFLLLSLYRPAKKLELWLEVLHTSAEFFSFQHAWWGVGKCHQVPLYKIKKLKKKDLIDWNRNYTVSRCWEQNRIQVCWLPLLHPIHGMAVWLSQKLSWAALCTLCSHLPANRKHRNFV